MKLQDIVNGVEALRKVADMPMPALQAYRLGVFIRKVAPYVEEFQSKRLSLAKMLGKAEGDKFVIPPENGEAFTEQLRPLLDEDVPVEPPKLRIDALGGNLTPSEMLSILWLFEDGNDAEEGL